MAEVLAMVIFSIFLDLIGFGMIYLTIKRTAILWIILATILFGMNVVYAGSIPFATDANGALLPTSANYAMISLNLLFLFLSLGLSILYGLRAFGGGDRGF